MSEYRMPICVGLGYLSLWNLLPSGTQKQVNRQFNYCVIRDGKEVWNYII